MTLEERELIRAEKLNKRIKEVRRNKIILLVIIIFATSLMIVGYNKYRKTFWNQCPDNNVITYEAVYIQSGDTVESIARDALSRHNMDSIITVKTEVDAIVKMNKLHNPNKIKYGNYILVPYYVKKGECINEYNSNSVARSRVSNKI